MIACKLGRTENVNVIIEEQNRQLKGLDEDDEDYNHYLEYHNYAKSTGPYKMTPLHFAAKNGYL